MTDFTDDLRKPLCREVRCVAERFTAATEIENLQAENETAWGIIANAFGSDWSLASDEWRQAAERWRDKYHETLKEQM